MSITRLIAVTSLTFTVITGLLWPPSAHAICALPSPNVTLTDVDGVPECLEFEVVSDGMELQIQNMCDQQATVEQVNCSDCDQVVTLQTEDTQVLAIPSVPVGVANTGYRWAVGDDSGIVKARSEIEDPGPCNDTVENPVDPDDSACSTGGHHVPLSWTVLVASGLTSGLLRRRHKRAV